MIEIKPVPFMEPGEIKALQELIDERKPTSVLEWGSGGSTLYWPAMYPEIDWVTIEHDRKFFDAIVDRLPGNVTFFRLDFPMYHELWEDLGRFDLIIVDGRERVKCLNTSRDLLSPNGAVVLHDSARKRYAPGFTLFNTVTELHPPKSGKDPRGLMLLTNPNNKMLEEGR